MKYRHVLASVALACVLAGCGGGGGGGGGGGAATDAARPAPLGGGAPATGSTSDGAPGAGGAASGGGTVVTDPGAAPVAQSAAFQVNTATAGPQNSPSVASLEDGGYVVAWHTDDPGANGIYLRRYAADGTPVGGEMRIDDPIAGRLVSVPKLTALEGGGYAVGWQSSNADFSGWAVHLRHVRADGTLRPVRTETVRWFTTYELASLAGGGHAVLLQGPTDDLASDPQVRMERFGPDDALVDSQLVDMGYVLQGSVHAVKLADGRRLLSWVRNDGVRGGTVNIFFRFMAADGTLDPVGHGGGQVSGSFASYVPAALRDGGFVVAGTYYGADSSEVFVEVQRYAADGTPVGARMRADDESDARALGTSCTMSDKGGVHPCPFPWQLNPAVAGTADGGFVVAWETPDRQRPGRFVYARRFDGAGTAIGAPLAGDAARPEQGLPVAASLGDGFVIAWIGRDADQSGIFARQYGSGELR